jgi:predicted methyltransferase
LNNKIYLPWRQFVVCDSHEYRGILAARTGTNSHRVQSLAEYIILLKALVITCYVAMLLATLCAPSQAVTAISDPDPIARAVADPDRPADDIARDANRKPAQTLIFAGVKPGDQVADYIANSGYFTRLFANAVGRKGHVYAIELNEILTYPNVATGYAGLKEWAKGRRNVTVETVPASRGPVFPHRLDVFWISQNYHDLHNKLLGPVDLADFNKKVFEALKPGGTYIVLDHVAATGSPPDVTETLHRIEAQTVKREVMAAGFELVAQSSILANPSDPHTAGVFDKSIAGRTDQFILKFRRPLAGEPTAASDVAAPAVASPDGRRDGQHDFDFNVGVWQTHIRRILDPLSGSIRSIELNGTVAVRKVWNGRGQLEEIETDGPNGHWEGLTLFLYNPVAHQWSQTFINSKAGELTPPLIGEFNGGRGELFSQDTYEGRSILVRGTWSNIQPDSHHFEEAYSADGGKTWAPAFIADLSRSAESAATVAARAERIRNEDAALEGHEFDFHLGTWKEHSKRLLHPLTGSTNWVEMDGRSVVTKVWGGRASLVEFKADGPAGGLELLSLRWYNPSRHEWNVEFATPNVGTLGVPGVGVFEKGRGSFYDQEVINGKTVLVRFSAWGLGPNAARTEQAFSADGGRTWETNWINNYTRTGE